MSEQKPVAWMDDFGNAFPLGANKGAASWMDDHKRNWKPLFLAAPPAQPIETLPLDYLRGFRDGLEWAADLAEAEDPRTSDWMYDDRNDLAEAIRRGPEMPPAQPARQLVSVSSIDIERMITECLPGGHSCDPQQVADAIRQYCNAAQPAQAQPARLSDGDIEQALRRAYNLGQVYWQQADSEFTSEHRKADATSARFNALIAETIAAAKATK